MAFDVGSGIGIAAIIAILGYGSVALYFIWSERKKGTSEVKR
jgi:hypothetical protein